MCVRVRTLANTHNHTHPHLHTYTPRALHQIVVMLGENGMGKTTFIRLLAGLLKPDGEDEVPKVGVLCFLSIFYTLSLSVFCSISQSASVSLSLSLFFPARLVRPPSFLSLSAQSDHTPPQKISPQVRGHGAAAVPHQAPRSGSAHSQTHAQASFPIQPPPPPQKKKKKKKKPFPFQLNVSYTPQKISPPSLRAPCGSTPRSRHARSHTQGTLILSHTGGHTQTD